MTPLPSPHPIAYLPFLQHCCLLLQVVVRQVVADVAQEAYIQPHVEAQGVITTANTTLMLLLLLLVVLLLALLLQLKGLVEKPWRWCIIPLPPANICVPLYRQPRVDEAFVSAETNNNVSLLLSYHVQLVLSHHFHFFFPGVVTAAGVAIVSPGVIPDPPTPSLTHIASSVETLELLINLLLEQRRPSGQIIPPQGQVVSNSPSLLLLLGLTVLLVVLVLLLQHALLLPLLNWPMPRLLRGKTYLLLLLLLTQPAGTASTLHPSGALRTQTPTTPRKP